MTQPQSVNVRSTAGVQVPPAVLSDAPASAASRRTVLVAVSLSLGFFLALLPFAKLQLPTYPLFVPLTQSLLVVNDLLTALLLLAQLRLSRNTGVLVLGCGYVFVAALAALHMLTFPGAFTPQGLLGADPQRTPYLYLFWHAGFPLAVAAYACLRDRPLPVDASLAKTVAMALTITATAVVLIALLSTRGGDLLPPILAGNQYSEFNVFRSSLWLLPIAAAALVWRRQVRSVLDLWLLVVLAVWFSSVSLTAIFNAGRYDVGFYGGRLFALLASVFILIMFLLEQYRIYADLQRARSTAESEAALRQGREVLSLAMRSGRMGAWSYDNAGAGFATSPELEAIFGMPARGGATREELRRLVHREDYPQLIKSAAAAVKDDREFDVSFRFRHVSGEWRWIEARGQTASQVGGRPGQLFGVAADITDRKSAEDALRASDARHLFLVMLTDTLRPLTDPIAVQAEASRVLCEWLRADRVAYFEVHGDDYVIQRDYSPAAPSVGGRHPMSTFGSDLLATLLAGRVVVEPDVDAVERRSAAERAAFAAVQIRAHVGVPLVKGGRLVAGLTVQATRPRAWTPTEVAIIEDTAQRTWEAVERVRAEAALRTSEERFRSLVTATTQIVWTSTADGEVVEDSPTWRAFTGQTVEQRLGWGWADAIHPDDQEATQTSWRRALATTSPLKADYRLRRHDGEYRWMTVSGVPVMDEAGVLREWVGTNTDITERKRAEEALRQSEERYRVAIAIVSDVIWTNTADGLMQGEQRGWGDFTGQSPEEYQGYGWSKAVHPGDAQPTVDAWIHTVAEKSVFVFEHRVRRRDGQWRLCSIRAVPLLNADGTIREWVGVHIDITERRRDEDKLRQLASDLSEVDRRKDEFLATLAHELRNPLAPIRTGLQLMKLARGQQATIEQTRSMMERQLTQMVRLVDDLMDVSRISRGKLELRKEPVTLAAVVNSAVETNRPLIEQMGHELTVTLPKQPLIVDADMTRLAQVFLNLLNNAARYSDRGARIQLNVELQGSDAVVTVSDTGSGIAADQLPRIFEMFTQVDKSLEKSQGGLGIGLTLVKRLVEMHGGSVEAKSEGLGKGSEFVVRLPVVVEALKPQAPGVEDEPAVTKSSLRILIVDDNRDGADTLSDMLKILGNDTRAAYDGQQGMDTAGEYRPNVILLDIGMPKLNGYEACRLIREQPWGQGVVLIAMTGWGQDKDRRRSHEAGFDHHLVKPVDPQALMKTLAGLQVSMQ